MFHDLIPLLYSVTHLKVYNISFPPYQYPASILAISALLFPIYFKNEDSDSHLLSAKMIGYN
jgi:hypothetical protein